ncbi:MAG: CAP domain-containing protein [Defluviitaleaceae bacterium]|nr:CAP domain-containing protein [Defluviitaleaceae bacterium]
MKTLKSNKTIKHIVVVALVMLLCLITLTPGSRCETNQAAYIGIAAQQQRIYEILNDSAHTSGNQQQPAPSVLTLDSKTATVYINDAPVRFGPVPFIDIDGRTFIPIDYLEETLGVAIRRQQGQPYQSQEIYEFERRLLDLTNMERARHGLLPLAWDSDLARAALLHSMDMGINRFVSHVGSDGLSFAGRVRQASPQKIWAGENIAAGINTPERTIEAWMRSPGHRVNILNENFTHMGVGLYICEASRWGVYITQKFGS